MISIEKVKEADVIAATLTVAANLDVDFKIKAEFVYILMDEASQTTELKSLSSIGQFCEKLILVGDQKQLGPVLPEKAQKLNYKSLFERMIDEGQKQVTLDIQYRMNPKISDNSSELFYYGELKSGVTESQKSMYKQFIGSLFVKDDPRVYVDVTEGREVEINRSFVNYKEIQLIKLTAEFIMESFRDEKDKKALPTIGIISNYKQQVEKLIESIVVPQKFQDNIQIDTVDAFQGREVDFVIISTVRANENGQLGFLRDARRMNVAITRGRHGLIIFGNYFTLMKEYRWDYLLQSYWKKGLACKAVDYSENLSQKMNKLIKTRGPYFILE